MLLGILYKQMDSLKNVFSSDYRQQKKPLDIVYRQMVLLQNGSYYESSDKKLQKKSLSILYKQMAFLPCVFLYVSWDLQTE